MKQETKKNKMLSTKLENFDSFEHIATTSNSVSLSVTGFGLIATPLSIGIGSGMTISITVKHELNIQNVS